MKPARFAYVAPSTVEDALYELERGGDEAKLLAGGQSLVPLMNFRLTQIELLVDLNAVTELSYIRSVENGLAIGAMSRARELERSALAADRVPLIPRALAYVGHPQIRNRGTIGGSIAHADPAAELPTVAVALDAQLVVRSPVGERVVPAGEFFVTYLTTCMGANEILTEIRIPALPGLAGSAFVEYARRHGDFAIAGVAAVVSLDENGCFRGARVALSGVADRPLDVSSATAGLVGRAIAEREIREVGQQIAASLEPPADIHASAEFRRRISGVMVGRALQAAAREAQLKV